VPINVDGVYYASGSEGEEVLYRPLPVDEQQELDAAESSLGEEEDVAVLQLDMFAEVAMELEQEHTSILPRKRQRLSVPAGSPLKLHVVQIADEEGWAVRDFEPTGETAPVKATSRARSFNFASRQEDAVRVDWESQSPDPVQRSATPKARHISHLPALIQASKPRSILRSPRLDLTPKEVDPVRHPASALRLQYATSSPRFPFTLPRRAFQSRKSDPSILPPTARVSLNPAAELIAIRTTRTPPVSSQSAQADDEAEEEEFLEEDEVQDLLPDTAQLNGNIAQSSDEPRTTQDADFADLLPDTPQMKVTEDILFLDGSGALQGLGMDLVDPGDDTVVPIDPANVGGVPISDLDLDPLHNDASSHGAVPNVIRPVHAIPPISQRAIMSRPRKSREAQEFALPDPNEEEEDRQLLGTASKPRVIPRSSWGTNDFVKQSPGSPDVLKPAMPRPSGRAFSRAREAIGEDLYLVDTDGSPLGTDSNYMIPRNHIAKRSRIHGQVEGQSTSYSRISGRRKWTKAEEVLLYRTVQKIPLSEEYPLRVVWYLHGEYGSLSQVLEQFNPQHMKDKMRVIVSARVNNRRSVTGRARFFLPGSHPDKVKYHEEMDELRSRGRSRFPTVVSEKDELESDDEVVAVDEDDHELDELVSDAEEAEATPTLRGRKRTRATSKAGNGHVTPPVHGSGDAPHDASPVWPTNSEMKLISS